MIIKFVSIGHLPKEREVLSLEVCLEWRKICKYVSAWVGGERMGGGAFGGENKGKGHLPPSKQLVSCQVLTISYNTVAQWAILSLNTPI